MTKDKFKDLCEQVLVPHIGNLLHRQLAELHDSLEVVAAALARIERKLDRGEVACAHPERGADR